MGEILQIRVIAQTFTPEKARKRWEKLFTLAEKQDKIEHLLPLVERLQDIFRFEKIQTTNQQTLPKKLEAVINAKDNLAEYLANRNPTQADKASYALEEALDELEHNMP